MPRPYPRPRSSEGARRNGASIAVALLVHAVVMLMVAQAIMQPARIMGWLGIADPRDPSERVVYVEPLPADPIPVGVPGAPPPAAGDPSTAEPPTDAPPLVAPREIPVGIPDPEPGPPDATPGGVPGGTGRGAPTQGLVPRYTDPRLWGEVPEPAATPRTTAETIDSIVGRDLRSYQDSLRRAAEARRPGDWTIDRDGQKWGIDPQFIRLGRFSIPTAVLGLLPLNAQGNPVAIERDRSMGEIRRQIDAVDRMQNVNADLRSQANEIRARADRERELRRQREEAKSSPPPVASEPPR